MTGYEHLSDAEIIADVISLPTSDAVCSDDETETVAMDSSSSSSSSWTPSITHVNTVKMFDNCITWLLDQAEAKARSKEATEQHYPEAPNWLFPSLV